ncbi:MAG: hypothetical protein WBF37_02715 [Dehalococcoidia bacterium]
MKKRLILVSLGAMAVLIGVATFAANTAQWVNVQARVEKEIEVACVGRDGLVDPDGCDFGIVFPQNPEEKIVEVTLSNSFYNQDVKSDVLYWVLWECKQFSDERDVDPKDGIPDCRVDVPRDDHELCYDDVHGKWMHCDEELDGMIRDYITVTPSDPSCLTAYNGPTGLPKHIEGIGNGVVDDFVQGKCFYHLAFQPPACEGHFNPFTDPAPAPETVECHEIVDEDGTNPDISDDPQDWDRFADLGDDFKIQVYDFSYHD